MPHEKAENEVGGGERDDGQLPPFFAEREHEHAGVEDGDVEEKRDVAAVAVRREERSDESSGQRHDGKLATVVTGGDGGREEGAEHQQPESDGLRKERIIMVGDGHRDVSHGEGSAGEHGAEPAVGVAQAGGDAEKHEAAEEAHDRAHGLVEPVVVDGVLDEEAHAEDQHADADGGEKLGADVFFDVFRRVLPGPRGCLPDGRRCSGRGMRRCRDVAGLLVRVGCCRDDGRFRHARGCRFGFEVGRGGCCGLRSAGERCGRSLGLPLSRRGRMLLRSVGAHGGVAEMFLHRLAELEHLVPQVVQRMVHRQADDQHDDDQNNDRKVFEHGFGGLDTSQDTDYFARLCFSVPQIVSGVFFGGSVFRRPALPARRVLRSVAAILPLFLRAMPCRAGSRSGISRGGAVLY